MKTLIVISMLLFASVAFAEGNYCPEPFKDFTPSNDNLAIRGHWRIVRVEAGYGYSEGIVLQYKANSGYNQSWWSVLRIGHEGISRFFFWDEGGPFEIDCYGRVKMNDLCPACD